MKRTRGKAGTGEAEPSEPESKIWLAYTIDYYRRNDGGLPDHLSEPPDPDAARYEMALKGLAHLSALFTVLERATRHDIGKAMDVSALQDFAELGDMVANATYSVLAEVGRPWPEGGVR